MTAEDVLRNVLSPRCLKDLWDIMVWSIIIGLAKKKETIKYDESGTPNTPQYNEVQYNKGQRGAVSFSTNQIIAIDNQ